MNRKQIANIFNIPVDSIEQIGSKNLFILNYYRGSTILISYRTIVGQKINNRWQLTTERYSATTGRQLSQFARDNNAIFVDNWSPSYEN